MFLSLDGFVVGPREEMNWVINNFDVEGMGPDMSKIQASADSFLMVARPIRSWRVPGRTRPKLVLRAQM
jgi:hypothetical protein